MDKKDKNNEIAQSLMDGAINAVANFGLEGLTTKQIAVAANVSENYIYRYYVDRDDLLRKTFEKLDKELFEIAKNYCVLLKEDGSSMKERAYKYFLACWAYIADGSNKCKFYVRYYNSTFFKGETVELHKKNCDEFYYMGFANAMKEKEISIVRHSLFALLLSQAMDVANGKVKNDDTMKKAFFEVLYSLVKDYMK